MSRPYVIIPMKDRMDLTKALLKQLVNQGGYEEILIFDNGSNAATKRWLVKQIKLGLAHVFEASDMNIHQMWNAGLDYIDGRGHAAILNNDLKIGPNFLQGLATALDGDLSLVAVCPNYDARSGTEVQYTTQICANKYDGTGGLAGFAFMLRKDWSYRFPEELIWWFGDNHMVVSTGLAGRRAGIVLDTTVEHVGGGNQTAGDWRNYRKQVALDELWYRWWYNSHV